MGDERRTNDRGLVLKVVWYVALRENEDLTRNHDNALLRAAICSLWELSDRVQSDVAADDREVTGFQFVELGAAL